MGGGSRRPPLRLGLTTGNEFADPALFAQDARLYSHSKLRTCAIGPELVLDADYGDIRGSVRVERRGQVVWTRDVITGQDHSQFTLNEMEHLHFQYSAHRIPGDVHVHYLGGSTSSYADGIRLDHGDHVVMEWQGLGRPLRNLIERVSARRRCGRASMPPRASARYGF